MSLTKDGFYNIEGQVFEVIRGVEGDCLTLGDEDGGTRISGQKPCGGGHVTKTFVTQEKYGPIERLEAENTKLREQVMHLRDDWESERDYADQMEAKEKRAVSENAKLRELVVRMRPICVEGKRCTFADRIYISSTMEELGIEVKDD